jgi:hypothetical protein
VCVCVCVRARSFAGPWVKWGLAATIRSDLMRSRGHNSNKSKSAPVTQSKLHSHRATDKQNSRHKSPKIPLFGINIFQIFKIVTKTVFNDFFGGPKQFQG